MLLAGMAGAFSGGDVACLFYALMPQYSRI
jgi:hypothetical protein